MGQYSTAQRSFITRTFEASAGDMKGDIEPAFVEWKQGRKPAFQADVRTQAETMEVRYRVSDATLDDSDIARVFLIAYLDAFTDHHWRNKNSGRFSSGSMKIKFVNDGSGATSTIPYPDPE